MSATDQTPVTETPARSFAVGDRVQDRPSAAEHQFGPGTVTQVDGAPGEQFVAVRHDNGARTSWWATELEPAAEVARPFQVGDRVRITDHNRRHVAPDIQYVFEGIVSKIDPAAAPESGHEFGPFLWIDTDPFTNGSGETRTATFCPLTDDLSAGLDPAIGRTIELLDPAPKNTSTGAVTAPTPAPVDDNTHTLDRIPGEPNPLDPYPLYGFTTTTELVDGLDVQTPPRVWITAEHFRDLGEPQQITVTITAGAK